MDKIYFLPSEQVTQIVYLFILTHQMCIQPIFEKLCVIKANKKAEEEKH